MSTPSGLDIERSSAAYDPEVATSASSRRLNRRGLERVRWSHDGTHPGSPFAWKYLRYVTTFLVYPISKQRD